MDKREKNKNSSPAAELKPEVSPDQIQITLHLTSDINKLDRLLQVVLGVGLEEIKKAF